MGLKIERYYTDPNHSVYGSFVFELRESNVKDLKGQLLFEQNGVEVPAHWSQTATDILAQKYFRKTDVPQKNGTMGGEYSIRQVVHRMASAWSSWGNRFGYFESEEDRKCFYDETVYMMLGQFAAPNSPQWFNTGLFETYGIRGEAQGHCYIDPESHECIPSTSAYEYPQTSACFIMSVKDDLLSPGGIMDLLLREAKVFKHGSGSGTNYSALRGKQEHLSGGGYSSGLMSFLRVSDTAAGAIRSGGTIRRAAKMNCLDADHPEVEDFIRWKAKEELKAEALIRQGYSSGMEGEAYRTVSGQNSTNAVRFPDEFFNIMKDGGKWNLQARTTGETLRSLKSAELWSLLSSSAWRCADPGVQFDTTINDWNTCSFTGRINASNPCSEFLFLDDTSCNLASLNLVRFINRQTGEFDIKGFQHACRIWTIVLEITVLMSQYPSEEVALNSFKYRPLGLGYTNLGTLCMATGSPYDSEKSRSMAAALAAIMTATSYLTSAEMAVVLGPFDGFSVNKSSMLKVIHNHRAAITGDPEGYQSLSKLPQGIKSELCPKGWVELALSTFDEAIRMGEKSGFRNAQVTAVAPTGTIALVMDCDTTGIEPEFALVKLKQLAGGGTIKMVNRHIPETMYKLGYNDQDVDGMMDYILHNGTLERCSLLKKQHRAVFATAQASDHEFLISTEGHLLMIAAVQPFISGGISKTINLPASASIRDVGDCFMRAWHYGLKAVTVYREGSKSSQPLTGSIGKTKHTMDSTCPDCGFPYGSGTACLRCTRCDYTG